MAQANERITPEPVTVPTGDICSRIVTLANTYGGELLIGVTDGGAVAGVTEPENAIRRTKEMVRDYIRPDVSDAVGYEVREMDGKQIVAVTVRKGSRCPYRLAFFGFGRGRVADIIAPQEHYLDFCNMFKQAGLSFPL